WEAFGFQPCCLICQQARGFYIGGHISQLERDALVSGDWFSELLSFFSIIDGFIERPLCDTKCLGGNSITAAIQSCHRNFEPFPFFAKQIFFGDTAIFKNEFRRRGGTNAEFLLFFSKCEAFRSFFHDECADAFV